jgi:hypothetical protein
MRDRQHMDFARVREGVLRLAFLGCICMASIACAPATANAQCAEPIRLELSGARPLVDISFGNGRKAKAVFDTGAMATIVNIDKAAELGLKNAGSLKPPYASHGGANAYRPPCRGLRSAGTGAATWMPRRCRRRWPTCRSYSVRRYSATVWSRIGPLAVDAMRSSGYPPLMDLSHPATLLLPAGIAALVGWRLYSRIKRMVGRQRLSRVRPWLTLFVFPLAVALLLFASLSQPYVALALLAGVVVGAGLGLYGLRLTKFEQTPLGLFYTPNAHLGIALSLLLIGRIAYRLVQLYIASEPIRESSAAFGRSPLTLLIFGTLAGYYVAYAVGLLRWRRRVGLDDPSGAADR